MFGSKIFDGFNHIPLFFCNKKIFLCKIKLKRIRMDFLCVVADYAHTSQVLLFLRHTVESSLSLRLGNCLGFFYICVCEIWTFGN